MDEHNTSRRRLLANAGAAVAVTAAAAVVGPATAAADRRPTRTKQRPNILWLVSEDNNDYLGAHGDRLANTPTIDGLARAGARYRNAYSTAPACAPSRFAIIPGVCQEAVGPAEHMRATAALPDFMRGFPEYLREAGYHCTNNSKTDYNFDLDVAVTWDASSGSARWSDRPEGAPFFAVFNFMTTHESQLFNNAQTAVDPATMTVPAFLSDTPNVRADRDRQYERMAVMDTQVAARLAELEEAGVAEDTIVFYYGDNGGVMPWSKRHANDPGLRVPLIAYFPRRWAHLAPAHAGAVLDAPVTLMDLGPTTLSLAGVPVPKHVNGQVLAGKAHRRPRQYAFGGRDRMDERYDLVRTVTDGRLRYVRNYAPHRPYGQVNAYAWQLKSYQDRRADLARLRRVLDERIFEVDDNGFIPEGSPAEGYDNSPVKGAYPLREVKNLADRAIARDRGNLGHFVRELGNRNYVLRYWAAQGLLMLDLRSGRSLLRQVERRWDSEQSDHVKVVLAEVLVKLGIGRPAVAWLVETLDIHDKARVRLQAANALTYVGDAALPALPALDRAVEGTDQFLRNCGRYLGLVLRGEFTPQTQLYV